jgi:hypothetical protein
MNDKTLPGSPFGMLRAVSSVERPRPVGGELHQETPMRYPMRFFGLVVLFFCLAPIAIAQDYSLQYFLTKVSSEAKELSKNEREALFNRMDEVLGQARQIHSKLMQAIQAGELDIRYQEGRFWVTKLEQDQGAIENGIQQMKLLRNRPTHLVASIQLYKSLKDLSSNFNAYNNMPSFSALVGDLAPEMELWADPIFYRLYLLPLAQLKDVEKASSQKEKKPVPKGKKP